MRPFASKSVPRQAFRRAIEHGGQVLIGAEQTLSHGINLGYQTGPTQTFGRSITTEKRSQNWKPIRVITNSKSLVRGETYNDEPPSKGTVPTRIKPCLFNRIYGQLPNQQNQNQPQVVFKQANPPLVPRPPKQINNLGVTRKVFQRGAFKYDHAFGGNNSSGNVTGNSTSNNSTGGKSFEKNSDSENSGGFFKPVPPTLPKAQNSKTSSNPNSTNNSFVSDRVVFNSAEGKPISTSGQQTKSDIPNYFHGDFGGGVRGKLGHTATNLQSQGKTNETTIKSIVWISDNNDKNNNKNSNTIQPKSREVNSGSANKNDVKVNSTKEPLFQVNITKSKSVPKHVGTIPKSISTGPMIQIMSSSPKTFNQMENRSDGVNRDISVSVDTERSESHDEQAKHGCPYCAKAHDCDAKDEILYSPKSGNSSNGLALTSISQGEAKTRSPLSSSCCITDFQSQLATSMFPSQSSGALTSPLLFGGKLIPSGQDIVNLYNHLCQSNPNIYSECKQGGSTSSSFDRSVDLPVLYLSSLELQELKTVNKVYYIDPNWEIILNANVNMRLFGSSSNTPIGDYNASSRGNSISTTTSSNNIYQRIDMNNIFKHVQVSSSSIKTTTHQTIPLSNGITGSRVPSQNQLNGVPLSGVPGYEENVAEMIKRSKLDYMLNFHPPTHTNSHGEYTCTTIGSHISFRYKLMEVMGKGSFGMCLKVDDYAERFKIKTKSLGGVASSAGSSLGNQDLKSSVKCLKILRSKPRVTTQGKTEVSLLQYVLQKDSSDTSNIVRMERSFMTRGHLAIVFELLSMNLYELICRYSKSNYGVGGGRCMPLSLIRKLSVQILNALLFLHSHHIIHADIKPENILLKNPTKSGVKVIDLGSSCFIEERIYSYIQSRFYRAPEVMMGYPYGYGIDIWSMGCVLAELYTGRPLFPGECEADQMRMFVEVLGKPSEKYIQAAPRGKEFYEKGELKSVCFGKHRKIIRNRPLECVLACEDRSFVDFIRKCLTWDVNERLTGETALDHPWMAETIRMLRDMSGGERDHERDRRAPRLPNINVKE